MRDLDDDLFVDDNGNPLFPVECESVMPGGAPKMLMLQTMTDADKSTRDQRKHSFEVNLNFAYIIPLFQL